MMPSRSNTAENLSMITNRNDGRRRSLDLNDEYNSTASKETNILTALSEKEENSKEKETDHHKVIQAFSEINKATHLRFKGKRKPSAGSKDEYVSRFGDIKFYKESSTMFDSPSFKESQFFGIYILFWLATGFLIFNNVVHNYFEYSESFFECPVVLIMKKDIIKVGLTDMVMYLTTYFSYFLQYACLKGWITWSSSGWLIQIVYDFFHLWFWLHFASEYVMGFPWIAKIFLLLHNCVFLMKMHSYGFYNGYLWKVKKELEFSETYLAKLEKGLTKLPDGFDFEKVKKMLFESITFCRFELEYQSSATTLSSDYIVDQEKVDRDVHKSHEKDMVKFPRNINLYNFFEFSMFPTVVYTLNFPRTPNIRWKFVFEKTCAIFGVIFLMISIAQNWLYPHVLECLEARQLPLEERIKRYLFILLDVIPPFLMEYLFTFYLIWDAILNDIAELTRFADRDFYGPWWSCTDWSEFSRIWNRPVHKFLLRHVYHSSISAFQLNKIQAALATFMLSSLLHELAMYVIFGTLRGYLLLLQMSQIPLIMLSRTRYMKDKKVLGNVICWFGFISGPSMICTLYLVF